MTYCGIHVFIFRKATVKEEGNMCKTESVENNGRETLNTYEPAGSSVFLKPQS